MSCQYAIPMGELAGRNAVAELLGDIPQPFAQPHYVTCWTSAPLARCSCRVGIGP
jgi:hypothetical protein